MNEPYSDTIAAIATAIGACGIGVIRISGPQSLQIASAVFKGRPGAPVTDYPSHTVHYGTLIDPTTSDAIDQILLTVFRSPASYTGEDTVELSCHGGSVNLQRALQAVLGAGARPAEPGEFTKRAFLNGRLDLAQAEAVNDIIRARTDDAQRLALRQLRGSLSREVSDVTSGILSILARIEAAIDFPDDVDEPDYTSIAAEIETLAGRVRDLLKTSDRGIVYREGINLAIVGKPNVGKSSLLNALLRESRAIVTSIPGTTRDVIEETVNIRGIPVVIADTAGIRQAMDEVEAIGVELTEQAMARANVALVVMDTTEGVNEEDREIFKRSGPRTIIVANKIDLLTEEDRKDVECADFGRYPVVLVSALSGEGIDDLENQIAATVLGSDISNESIFVINTRHKHALSEALESLARAKTTIDQMMPIDFLSVDLIAARMSLGEITGDTASEDLIDHIFDEFCIGK